MNSSSLFRILLIPIFIATIFHANTYAEDVSKNIADTDEDDGSVWVATREWDLAEEELYADWVATQVDLDFFVRHRIPTDCSDVPYVLRFVYARIRGLPQGAHNYRGKVFGNWNTEFENLPRANDWTRDKRFRRALRHLRNEFTLVRNISKDTYPIDIWPPAAMVRPGTVFSNGRHSGIVFSIDPIDSFPLKVAYSTLPPRIRSLILVNYEEGLTYRDIGEGLVGWNWWRRNPQTSEHEIVPDEQMPGYSLEQYEHPEDLAFLLHNAYASKRLSDTETVDEMIGSLRSALNMRDQVVKEAFWHYATHRGDRSINSYEYDCFSTPGRDARLRNKLDDMTKLVRRKVISESELFLRLRDEKIRPFRTPQISFLEFRHAMLSGRASPEPWDQPFERWGIHPAVSLMWMLRIGKGIDELTLTPEGWIYAFREGEPVARVNVDGRNVETELNEKDSVIEGVKEKQLLRSEFRISERSPDVLAFDDGNRLVVRAHGNIEMYDVRKEIVWTREFDQRLYSSAVTDGEGTIYLAMENGTLAALNRENGEVIWETPLNERTVYSPVVSKSGVIRQACTESLFAINPDGEIMWQKKLPEAIYTPVAVGADGTAYLGCLDKNLHALSREGERLWAFPMLSNVLVKPIVMDDGQIFVIASSGILYSLQTHVNRQK